MWEVGIFRVNKDMFSLSDSPPPLSPQTRAECHVGVSIYKGSDLSWYTEYFTRRKFIPVEYQITNLEDVVVQTTSWTLRAGRHGRTKSPFESGRLRQCTLSVSEENSQPPKRKKLISGFWWTRHRTTRRRGCNRRHPQVSNHWILPDPLRLIFSFTSLTVADPLESVRV